MTFWRLLDERGSNGFAAADLRLHLGEDWKTAPVQKARRMAEFIDDPLNPASALTVLEEQSGKIFVTSESHPLRAREVGAEEVELWVPDWRKISEQFSSALARVSHGCPETRIKPQGSFQRHYNLFMLGFRFF